MRVSRWKKTEITYKGETYTVRFEAMDGVEGLRSLPEISKARWTVQSELEKWRKLSELSDAPERDEAAAESVLFSTDGEEIAKALNTVLNAVLPQIYDLEGLELETEPEVFASWKDLTDEQREWLVKKEPFLFVAMVDDIMDLRGQPSEKKSKRPGTRSARSARARKK